MQFITKSQNHIIYSLISSFLLLINGSTLFGQCGTIIPDAHKENPIIIQDQNKGLIKNYLNKTLSVNVFVVASDLNTYDFLLVDYKPLWDELNEIFEPIGLSFELCFEQKIPNYNYNNDLVLGETENPNLLKDDEMFAQYYMDNVINVYYVESIYAEELDGVGGYAYLPGGPDIIVLRKSSGIKTLVHEIGHFFGLYHTFETSFGAELVNKNNCGEAGDLVCDTPADNNGEYSDGCVYLGPGTDANGDYYTPYLSNYMSYYGACVCRFTNGQYNRMAWNYLNIRNYLW